MSKLGGHSVDAVSEDSKVISRLMTKVSEQAHELSKLNEQLIQSSTYIERLELECRNHQSMSQSQSSMMNSSTTSDMAAKRRQDRELKLKFDALSNQLQLSELKILECSKLKNKIAHELDIKVRENKSLEKKAHDAIEETKQLRNQLDSLLRISDGGTSIKKSHGGGGTQTYEINRLKSELEKYQVSLKAAQESQKESQSRIRVLEDALEFRAEEIGLSGHADLLAKIASLRGQVTGLKNEISEKRQKLDEVESVKSTVIGEREALQRQIMVIQQRLVASEQDIQKLSNGDILQELKSTKQERDILLEFIQGDMEKSAVIAKELEKVKSEHTSLSQSFINLEKKLQSTEALLDGEIKKNNSLQVECNTAQIKLVEAEKFKEMYKHEKDHASMILNKKEMEIEELGKLQVNTLVQVQDKESRMHVLNDELRQSRTTLRELESLVPRLQTEAEALRDRIAEKDAELHRVSGQLRSVEPRLESLEPELVKLRLERESLYNERDGLSRQVDSLRPLSEAMQELVRDLSNINLSAVAQPSSTSSPTRAAALAGKQDAPAVPPIYSSHSQKHAMWTGLPSLRHFCPALYEKIRVMSQDLHRKEIECSELQALIPSLRREIDVVKSEYESDMMRVCHQHEQTSKMVDDYRGRLAAADEELVRLRGIRTVIDQIKLAVKTYPRGAVSVPSSAAGLGGNGEEKERDGSAGSSSMDFSMVPDHLLPEAIGRALMHNSNAVISLMELKGNYEQLQEGYITLEKEFNRIKSENFKLKQQLDLTHDESSRRDDGSRHLIGELKRELESATELAEKQNALTITLESKLESTKKEKQLKAAQLTSLHQKEESIRQKLYAILEDYARNASLETETHLRVPSSQAKLSDLIHFTGEVLTNLWHKQSLQAAKVYYGTSRSQQQQQQQQQQSHYSGHGIHGLGGSDHSLYGSGGSGGVATGTGAGASYGSSTAHSNSHLLLSGVSFRDSLSSQPSHHHDGPMTASATPSAAMAHATAASSAGHGLHKSVSAGVEDSARGLHDRLRKAQMNFASMKEPVDE